MDMFKDKCRSHYDYLLNKNLRVLGTPATILGMGKQSLKLGFPQPTGFSTKPETNTGFVKWKNVTEELGREILHHIPKSAGQQTLL